MAHGSGIFSILVSPLQMGFPLYYVVSGLLHRDSGQTIHCLASAACQISFMPSKSGSCGWLLESQILLLLGYGLTPTGLNFIGFFCMRTLKKTLILSQWRSCFTLDKFTDHLIINNSSFFSSRLIRTHRFLAKISHKWPNYPQSPCSPLKTLVQGLQCPYFSQNSLFLSSHKNGPLNSVLCITWLFQPVAQKFSHSTPKQHGHIYYSKISLSPIINFSSGFVYVAVIKK